MPSFGHSWAGWKIADPKVMTQGHVVAEELIYVPRERGATERKEIRKKGNRKKCSAQKRRHNH